MRSLRKLVAAAVGLVPLTVVLSGLAAPPSGGGAPRPSPSNPGTVVPNLAARVVAMKRAVGERGSTLAYTSGPLDWDVTIAAPTHAPLATKLLYHPGPFGHFEVPVNAAANTEVVVHVHDTQGLLGACGVSSGNVYLLSEPARYTLFIEPSCTFTTQVVDTDATIPPDTRHNQQQGKVYSAGTVLDAPFSCTSGFSVHSTVHNNAPATAATVYMGLTGMAEQYTWTSTVGPGGSQAVVIKGPAQGLAGDYPLWLRADGVPAHPPGWSVHLTPTCTLKATLKPETH